MSRLAFSSFLLLLTLSSTTATAQHPDPYAPSPRSESGETESAAESAPREVFFDEVTVDEVSVVVRITDPRGEPILGLTAEDLDVRVGADSVPVDDLRWHSSEASTFASENTAENYEDLRTTLSLSQREPTKAAAMTSRRSTLHDATRSGAFDEDGKLIVLFVQIGHHQVVTFDESWVTGHMKALPSMERLLQSLPDTDRVAVVSFDSRLKLWQDFSRDREATAKALWNAVGFGTPDIERAADGPSLFDTFDFEAAENTTSPEQALLVLGDALQAWREPKEILFLGWGLGRIVGGTVSMPPVYLRALGSLQKAQATVHVLNIVQMGGNALSAGLVSVAEATGGTYSHTFEFGRRKIERLARVIGGYYLLTLDPSDFPGLVGRLEVRLNERTGIKKRNVSISYRKMVVEGSSS